MTRISGKEQSAREPAGRKEKGSEPSRREQLEKRAADLARTQRGEESPGKTAEIVEFLIASERYGIESRYVREVFQARQTTAVPCAPPFVLGVINVRGRIVSVLDIRKFFDLPGREGGDACRVLILQSDAMEFGVLADEIMGVARVRLDDLQATLPTLTGVRVEYLKGVAADRLIVLDAGRMLADPGLVVHEEVTF